jgi:tetratricopeptide (TPR) repeat protein
MNEKKIFVDSASVKSTSIKGYEVFFEPLDNPYPSAIPKNLKKTYLELLQEAQVSPKGCLEKVLCLKKQVPASPEIDNLLTYLYIQHRKLPEAEKLIEEGYKKYPDYFFAKINFADQLLRKKQYPKVAQIFPSDELKDSSSHRTQYHVTEYRSFMVLKSRYYLAVGQRSKALEFYQNAHLADPAHTTVMALEKVLFKGVFFKKLINSLLKISKQIIRKKNKKINYYSTSL